MTTVPSHRTDQAYVGAYRLLAPIGEGGMGVVHLAQAPDGRRVALKVLRQHIVGDTEARDRLAREVSSLRRISSPRIAEVIDADPHGPVPYVVTRYVPGLSLYHHVAEEGPVAGADLLHFADALAEALQAVHAVGVLHRDIKPTNILMEGRTPVLIDFGLARVAEDPRLTQTGWLLGTPGYLAPEILYGDDATEAADVHAWAATVVYAATGRPPYGTGPTMAILDRVRRGEFNLAGVPDQLRRVVRESLSPEPLERPTVRELRSWLERLGQLPQPAATAERIDGAPEPLTMPYAPQPVPETVVLAPMADGTRAVAAPAATAAPTGVLPARSDPDLNRPLSRPLARPPAEPSGAQRVLQLLGLGVLTSALVAALPYVGVAVVAAVVLLLRTASVTRERHGRKRLVRGRPRWYDVPATTLSLPAYLVLALLGDVALLAAASFTAAAMFALAYLLGQSVVVGMVLGGLGFTPALWWGPGSGRVREMTRGLVMRTSRTEFGGWFVLAMCLLGASVLVGLLLTGGPSWVPESRAPWR